MTNLAYTKADIAEEKKEMAPGGDIPKYPYGLSLYLDDETLTKLGKTSADFKPGDTMSFPITVMVTGTSMRQQADGDPESCVDLQVTDIDMGPAPKSADEVAAKLYDKAP